MLKVRTTLIRYHLPLNCVVICAAPGTHNRHNRDWRPHKFKPDWAPALLGGSDTHSYPPPRSYLHLKPAGKGNLFQWCLPGVGATLQGGRHARGRVDQRVRFTEFLSYFALCEFIWLYLSLASLLVCFRGLGLGLGLRWGGAGRSWGRGKYNLICCMKEVSTKSFLGFNFSTLDIDRNNKIF